MAASKLFQWSSSYGVFVFSGEMANTGWGRRVAPRERWGRDAAKQDDGGRGPASWTITSTWGSTANALELPNLKYPDDLNWFERALRATGETGNLFVPFQGIFRAKVSTFRRDVGVSIGEDIETTTVVFVEDNEDTQAVAQWVQPSGASNLNTQVGSLGSHAGQAGATLSSPGKNGDFKNLASEVESLARTSAGSTWSTDLASRAARLDGQLRAVEQAYSRGGDDLGAVFRYASSARARAAVAELRDTLARIVTERQGTSPVLVRRYPVAVSVVNVAAEYNVEPAALLVANPALVANPLAIPAGTAIVIPTR